MPKSRVKRDEETLVKLALTRVAGRLAIILSLLPNLPFASANDSSAQLVSKEWKALITLEKDGDFHSAYARVSRLQEIVEAWADQAAAGNKITKPKVLAHLKRLDTLRRAEAEIAHSEWTEAEVDLAGLVKPGSPIDDDKYLLERARNSQSQLISNEWGALMALEKDGDFDYAYARVFHLSTIINAWDDNAVTGKKLDKLAALGHLGRLVTLQRAEAEIALGDWTRSETELTSLLAPTTAVDGRYDSHLLDRAQRRFTKEVIPALQRPWKNRITVANELLNRGLADPAMKLFTNNLDLTKAPSGIKAEVDKVLVSAEKIKATGSWRGAYETAMKTARDGSDKLLFVAFVVFLYVLFIVLQWFLFKAGGKTRVPDWLRNKQFPVPRALSTVYIDVTNLSQKGANDQKSAIENRRLGNRIAQAIDSISAGHYRRSDQAEALTVHESAQPTTQALGEGGSMDIVVQTPTPITIGSISVKLDPLFHWLQSLVSLKRYATRYEGALRAINDPKDGSGAVVGWELFMRRRGSGAPKPYYAYARCEPVQANSSGAAPNGSGTPENIPEGVLDDLIDNVAFQIVVDAGKAVTTSAKSLREYMRGMDLLERQKETHESLATLEKAVDHFQSALDFDQDNWLARYYLAFALRRLGRFLDAATNFDLVYEMLSSVTPPNAAASGGQAHLQNYLRKYTQLPDFLRWETYSSRAYCDNVAILKETQQHLNALIAKLGEDCKKGAAESVPPTPVEGKQTAAESASPPSGEGGRQNPGPCRLLWLCRAAKMTALAHRLELLTDSSERMELQKELKQEWDKFGSPDVRVPPPDVVALAQAAYGRSLYKPGNPSEALEILWRAANMQSGYRDPEVYETLARIYLHEKRVASAQWAEKAQQCVTELRKIEPGRQNAHLFYAHYLLATGNPKSALDEVKSAGDSAGAFALRGEILSKWPDLSAKSEVSGSESPCCAGPVWFARAAAMEPNGQRCKELRQESRRYLESIGKNMRSDPSKYAAWLDCVTQVLRVADDETERACLKALLCHYVAEAGADVKLSVATLEALESKEPEFGGPCPSQPAASQVPGNGPASPPAT